MLFADNKILTFLITSEDAAFDRKRTRFQTKILPPTLGLWECWSLLNHWTCFRPLGQLCSSSNIFSWKVENKNAKLAQLLILIICMTASSGYLLGGVHWPLQAPTQHHRLQNHPHCSMFLAKKLRSSFHFSHSIKSKDFPYPNEQTLYPQLTTVCLSDSPIPKQQKLASKFWENKKKEKEEVHFTFKTKSYRT